MVNVTVAQLPGHSRGTAGAQGFTALARAPAAPLGAATVTMYTCSKPRNSKHMLEFIH